MSEELKPCPFCGKHCVPEPRMDAFIISHGCKSLMHQLSCHSYEGWQNAHCWQQLALEKKSRGDLERKVKELVDKAETVTTHPCFTEGTLSYEQLSQGLIGRVRDLEQALRAFRENK